MDGNGRWALRKGLVRIKGHEAGVEAVRDSVRYAGQIHLEALTLYAFSTENWKRPRTEVGFLMRLLDHYLTTEFEELQANGVRLTAIGDTAALPEGVRGNLERVKAATAGNKGLTLCLALNYGSQAELARAAQALAAEVKAGKLSPDAIDEARLDAYLDTAGLPPVDLLLRTAGERRVSNFLLWQASGAWFHSTAVCWPEFRRTHLQAALEEYAQRACPA